ncbi:GntR family transcriptional regulator [Sinosporangium album]|uniref:GntR family transcriptional regulator n=1 Tax=Sinosporangium album TaxID=504805 RepID=UPI000B8923B0
MDLHVTRRREGACGRPRSQGSRPRRAKSEPPPHSHPQRNGARPNDDEDLSRRIAAGSYALGSFLPGELELAQVYQCSRPTMRKALRLLEDQGRITCLKGIGRRVVRTGA